MQWFSPPIVLTKHWNGMRSSFFPCHVECTYNPHYKIKKEVKTRKKNCCRRNSSSPNRTYCWAACTRSSFSFWRPYTPYWTPLQKDPGCTTWIKEKTSAKRASYAWKKQHAGSIGGETPYHRRECDIALCVEPCFEEYHTLIRFYEPSILNNVKSVNRNSVRENVVGK